MARSLGDRSPGATIDFKFNTHWLDGAPITLAGTPAISVYKDNGTSETTTGVTLSVDFDSRTGLHNVRIATTDAFYTAGSNFQVVITTGTVDGVSVVGAVVAEFTLGLTDALARSMGLQAQGTLSGTHSSSTADLGTNAPATDIAGMTLFIPGKVFTRLVDSYNTGTGVATFASTSATLENGDQWYLLATPQASAANPIPVNATQVAGEDITAQAGENLVAFFDNEDAATEQVVDDVGTGGGGSGPTAEEIADEVETRSLTVGTNNDKTGYGLADGAITAAKIATGAITNAKFAAGAIDAAATSTDFATEVQTAAAAALTAYDPPTNAEMVARTLASADYATAAALETVDGVADAIKVATDKLDTTLEADESDFRFTSAALTQAPTGSGGVTPQNIEDIRDAVLDAATSEHQGDGTIGKAISDAAEGGGGGGTDWTSDERTVIRAVLGIPGSGTTPADPSAGILDTIRDSVATRASQTSVDDLPTNGELAAALAAADDPVLAAVAAVDGKVDAVKDKTDDLEFDEAGVIASTQRIGATTLTQGGTGNQGYGG